MLFRFFRETALLCMPSSHLFQQTPLTGGGKAVAAFSQNLHQIIGEIATGQVQSEDGVGQGVAFVDGHRVGDAVAAVQNDTGGTTGGVQREYRLNGHVHRRCVERFEHDL